MQLPTPRGDKFIARPEDYYPFREVGWDEGKKICKTDYPRNSFPKPVNAFVSALLFGGLAWSETTSDAVVAGDYTFTYADDPAVLNHMSMIARSCATSHEQKEVTLSLMAEQWMKVL